jgi:hypothetical protein
MVARVCDLQMARSAWISQGVSVFASHRRNKKRFHHQALIEVKILEHLRDNDPEEQVHQPALPTLSPYSEAAVDPTGTAWARTIELPADPTVP